MYSHCFDAQTSFVHNFNPFIYRWQKIIIHAGAIVIGGLDFLFFIIPAAPKIEKRNRQDVKKTAHQMVLKNLCGR